MTRRHLLLSLLFPLLLCIGCSKSSDKRQFISMGTAPGGGAFPVVGGAICDVLNRHKGENDWKVSPKGSKGSQENIRRLQQGDMELGMSNAAISYFAARGEAGWTEKYDVRAIATMAPNVAMFITRADSGIESIADLKGKRVITGPAGAGFKMFIEPILIEHGLQWSDITSLNAIQNAAVDQLADGSADAAFLGGAVPTSSISQAASTFTVHFVPFDEDKRQSLIEKYPFFHSATIKGGTYKGLDEDYQGLNVGSMLVITSAAQDEDLIYQITKTIWENRVEIAEQHPAGKALNPTNVARDTGIEYHPGAVRFYQEAGIMPGGENADVDDAPTDDAPTGDASSGDARDDTESDTDAIESNPETGEGDTATDES